MLWNQKKDSYFLSHDVILITRILLIQEKIHSDVPRLGLELYFNRES